MRLAAACLLLLCAADDGALKRVLDPKLPMEDREAAVKRSEERRVGKECRYGWSPCQAEDGIRDVAVTGVQTCALPISQGGRVRRLAPQPGDAGAAEEGRKINASRRRLPPPPLRGGRRRAQAGARSEAADGGPRGRGEEIGRASCRERV